MAGPLGHSSVVYDVYDCAVYPMLTDVAGSAPTYGPKVDVPGITSVSIDPSFQTAQLKGDAQVIARKGRAESISFKGTYGKLSLDAQKVMVGGVITDDATNGSLAKWTLGGLGSLPYFKIEFAIDDLDNGFGDLHCTLFKCNLTAGTLLSGKTDAFGQPDISATGIPCFGTIPAVTGPPAIPALINPMIDITLYSALTALDA